jgi:DNA polymerase III epsilon subunit family exonuclease
MRSKKDTAILEKQIDETDFSIIDVETTGLSTEYGDRVCEVGIVCLRGGAVMETYSSLINPQRPISAGAYAVNKISPAMVANAPIFAEIADTVYNMINNTVVGAYNAPFDLSFIDYEFSLAGYPRVRNIVIDVLVLARQLLPGLGRYPQENVARVVGIPNPGKHRALEDAMVTAQLLTIFTSIMKAHDCSKISDLQRRDLGHVLKAKRWDIISNAMEAKKNLWIRYLGQYEITEDILTPSGIAGINSSIQTAIYLQAFCHSDQRERNIRIDRILDVRVV